MARTARMLLLVGLLAGPACGDEGDDGDGDAVITVSDGGEYDPGVTAAEFVDVVDHPFFPLVPGSRWVYEGESDGETERVEVVVLEERREVMGISATVVQDIVRVDGEVVEDTFDWFAQDRDGNVWYLGEESHDIEDGEVTSTEGSWEAGVDGALPGIIMPADPEVGFAYRQEFAEGEAEDLGEIIEVTADRVVTRDWNPLEPDVVEEKTYERGVGLVGERKTAGESGSLELVSFMPP